MILCLTYGFYRTSTSCLPRNLEFFSIALMEIFVTDISAFTERNDFILDIWLWHNDLYRVSSFQVYRTSTSCLPSDLEFFSIALIETFVTDISAFIGRNDFILDICLWYNDLYLVSSFQVYHTSTSCLPSDLGFFQHCSNGNFRNRYLSFYWTKWFYISDNDLYRVSSFLVYRTSTSC